MKEYMRLWYKNNPVRLKRRRDEQAREKHRQKKQKGSLSSSSSEGTKVKKKKKRKALFVKVFLAAHDEVDGEEVQRELDKDVEETGDPLTLVEEMEEEGVVMMMSGLGGLADWEDSLLKSTILVRIEEFESRRTLARVRTLPRVPDAAATS